MAILNIKGKDFLVDDEDFEWLNDLKEWRLVGGDLKYAKLGGRKYHGKSIYLHKIILVAALGHHAIFSYADHINRNPLDCRKANLRLVSSQENTWNRKPRKRKLSIFSSRFIGVHRMTSSARDKPCFVYDKWVAVFAGKNLGTFASEEEAARVYDQKCLEVRGKYAVLNYPQLAA